MVRHQGSRWRGQLPIPDHAHLLAREFIKAANEQDTTLAEIAERSNVRRCTMSGWRYMSLPRVELFEAALNALDLELRIRRRRQKKSDVPSRARPIRCEGGAA